MSVEVRPIGRQKVRYNSANDDVPLVYQLIVDGEAVTPTSATIAVSRNGTELLAATAMTLTGTLLAYSLDTTTTSSFPAAYDYRADIVVTYGGKTYDKHLIFNIEKYLFELTVAYDQLVSMDDTVEGMQVDGDETLAPLVAAATDAIGTEIESMQVDDDALRTHMVLDNSKLNFAAIYWILYQLFFTKDAERHQLKWTEYRERYRATLRAAVSSQQFDLDGDGEEDADRGGVQAVRLVL